MLLIGLWALGVVGGGGAVSKDLLLSRSSLVAQPKLCWLETLSSASMTLAVLEGSESSVSALTDVKELPSDFVGRAEAGTFGLKKPFKDCCPLPLAFVEGAGLTSGFVRLIGLRMSSSVADLFGLITGGLCAACLEGMKEESWLAPLAKSSPLESDSAELVLS